MLEAVHSYIHHSQSPNLKIRLHDEWSVVLEGYNKNLVNDRLECGRNIIKQTQSLDLQIKKAWPQGAYSVIDEIYHRGGIHATTMHVLVEASQKTSFDFAKKNLAIIIRDRLQQDTRLLTRDVEILFNIVEGYSRKRRRQPKEDIPRATKQRTIKEGPGEGSQATEDGGNAEREGTGVSWVCEVPDTKIVTNLRSLASGNFRSTDGDPKYWK